MKRILACVIVALIAGLFFVPFSQTKTVASEKTISGEVIYRERIALPPEAALIVQLADVSLADAAATIIAETSIQPTGQVPVGFNLSFDPQKIVPGHSYAIQARIAAGDTLWFVTDERHSVNPLDVSDSIVVNVTAVRQGTMEHETKSLDGTEWLAEDINGGGVIDFAQTTLKIGTDGGVTGSGGCNSFFATATLKDKEVSFSPVTTTYIQCAPALMDQETKFYEALARTKSYRIEDGKLYLIDMAGKDISRLALNG